MFTVKRISAISRPLTTVFVFLSAGLTLLVFTPGLTGGFLLDDYPNLTVLNQVPANPGVFELLELSGSGFAGLSSSRSISVFMLIYMYSSFIHSGCIELPCF